MNLNLVAYSIYGVFAINVTLFVGKALHKNGYLFILSVFEEEPLTNAINNILLVGYYLVNIGFSFVKIYNWKIIRSTEEMIVVLGNNIAILLIILGMLNFLNIAVLSFFRRRKQIIR